MNIVMNGPALRLSRHQRLKLVDAAGAVARIVSGQVWITLENDRRDIFLTRGDTWTIDRDGVTLVQAQEPSTVVLTESPARGALASVRALFAGWAAQAARRFMPYY